MTSVDIHNVVRINDEYAHFDNFSVHTLHIHTETGVLMLSFYAADRRDLRIIPLNDDPK